jgi:GNAT superfamily N-acetyltransferase
MAAFQIRPATPADVPAIVGLIGELAAFEQLSHLLQVTPETLAPHLFGPRPVAEALVVQAADQAGADTQPSVVAFALFFTNFSTFLAKPGLYLEDLYVQPAWRGQGVGKALLRRLGAMTVERGYGRFEWSVLDWNANAIRFYERMGATVMPDWRICRVTGEALARFATAPEVS